MSDFPGGSNRFTVLQKIHLPQFAFIYKAIITFAGEEQLLASGLQRE